LTPVLREIVFCDSRTWFHDLYLNMVPGMYSSC